MAFERPWADIHPQGPCLLEQPSLMRASTSRSRRVRGFCC